MSLERATRRLELASGAIGRWNRGNGEYAWSAVTERKLCRAWEQAWDDYKLALAVAVVLCPRRLRRWQKVLAYSVSEQLARLK